MKILLTLLAIALCANLTAQDLKFTTDSITWYINSDPGKPYHPPGKKTIEIKDNFLRITSETKTGEQYFETWRLESPIDFSGDKDIIEYMAQQLTKWDGIANVRIFVKRSHPYQIAMYFKGRTEFYDSR